METKRIKYHFHNGVKVEDEQASKVFYLVQHETTPHISASGKLKFKTSKVLPDVGVAVTSLTNKKYVVGPKMNLIRILKEK